MGFRRGYIAILGVVLIMYGVVLNLLGAIASFIHPGQYHQGAMGTPMWCGLAFILFGAINIQKSLDRNGGQILLSVINILVILTAALCIALTSWAMGAPGVAQFTANRVTDLTVASLTISLSTNASATGGDSDANFATTTGLQMSLLPIYSTVIAATALILLLACLAVCIDCVRVAARLERRERRDRREREHQKPIGAWDERDGRAPQYEIEDESPELQWDAMGEVTYGSPAAAPQVVQTLDRPRFHHHVREADQQPATNGGVPHKQLQSILQQPKQPQLQITKALQRSPANAGPQETRNRLIYYANNQHPKQREFERNDRRPNPYFYL